jgi:hypothetical protein
MDEVAEVAEVAEEPYAPGVGFLEEIDADSDVAAPGSSDVSQAWQDNNTQNIMSNYGLAQAAQDLNIEITENAINDIMRRYEQQNGSYGLTEPQFYEVIDELKGAIGGGRKRKGRKKDF